MKIQVCGFDPSLLHWGIAVAQLDLETGVLDTPVLSVTEPDELKGKQVRNNSNDLFRAQQLATAALKAIEGSKVIFVEVPVGSQNARSMASYGICVGILGSIKAQGVALIEVTPTEVKKTFTGNKTASKQQMIAQAVEYYPEANWPRQTRDGKIKNTSWKKGDLLASAEHMADAIAAIHAGCVTPEFATILQIYNPK